MNAPTLSDFFRRSVRADRLRLFATRGDDGRTTDIRTAECVPLVGSPEVVVTRIAAWTAANEPNDVDVDADLAVISRTGSVIDRLSTDQ